MKRREKMTINKVKEGSNLTVGIAGRLDTITAPDLEKELSTALDGVETLVMDLADLDYVSSAGLRVLLSAQKTMNKQGSMKLINVKSEIMEIFDVTGFSDILTIE